MIWTKKMAVYRMLTGLLAIIVALPLAGCGKEEKTTVTAETSGYEPADDSATSPAPTTDSGTTARKNSTVGTPTAPPAATSNILPPTNNTEQVAAEPSFDSTVYNNPVAVADGTAAELLATLERLNEQWGEYQIGLRQQAETGAMTEERQAIEFPRIVNLMDGRILAADKILAAQPTPEQKMAALQASADALTIAVKAESKNAQGRLDVLKKLLLSEADPELKKLGRFVSFGSLIDKLKSAAAAEKAAVGKQLLAEIKSMIDELKKDRNLFESLNEGAEELHAAELYADVETAFAMIGSAFLSVSDPNDPSMALEAQNMLDQAPVITINTQLQALNSGDQTVVPAMVSRILTLLNAKDVKMMSVAMAGNAVWVLHGSGQENAVKQLVQPLAAATAKLLAADAIEADLITLGQTSMAVLHETGNNAAIGQFAGRLAQLTGALMTAEPLLPEYIDMGQQVFMTLGMVGQQQHAEKLGPSLVAGVRKLLATEQMTTETKVGFLQLAQETATNVEFSGNVKTAGMIYTEIENALRRFDDQTLMQNFSADVEMGKRRLALVGQPFSVEGVNIDGTPFNWAKFKGKLVLIDFWATWCGPCLDEIPNIKAAYDKYHDKGFEVVSINLDDDPAVAREHLQSAPLPWSVVVGETVDQYGFNNPNAVKCAVSNIPFILLVGPDGKVAKLHVRGERLDKAIASMLGVPGAASVEKKSPVIQASATEPVK